MGEEAVFLLATLTWGRAPIIMGYGVGDKEGVVAKMPKPVIILTEI